MRYVLRAPLLALTALTLIAAGCGGGSDSTITPDSDGVVEIAMRDTRYEPDRIQVAVGDTVTFRFENEGAIAHEAFIGDEAAQEAHEAEMSASTMTTEHGAAMDPQADSADPGIPLRLEPGATGTLDYTFRESGTILIGCHEPGHWAAGMRAEIRIG